MEETAVNLQTHEANSQSRYESLKSHIHELKKDEIMTHGVNDEINIHNHGADGGGMGGLGGLAALASMGRNHGHGLGSGLGAGLLGGVVGGLLFGNGRNGGLLGGGNDGGGGQAASDFITLQTLGQIKEGVATSANETQAVVNANGANSVQSTLQQTIALQQTLGSLAQSVSMAFSNTNDRIANVNQNVSEQGCATRAAITAAVDVITGQAQAFETARNQEKINALNAEVIELRNESRRNADNADLRMTITNNNTAIAAQQQGQLQAQQQQQFATIAQLPSILGGLVQELQIARATNSNVIVGNTGATTTGAMNANPTNVRA